MQKSTYHSRTGINPFNKPDLLPSRAFTEHRIIFDLILYIVFLKILICSKSSLPISEENLPGQKLMPAINLTLFPRPVFKFRVDNDIRRNSNFITFRQ